MSVVYEAGGRRTGRMVATAVKGHRHSHLLTEQLTEMVTMHGPGPKELCTLVLRNISKFNRIMY